MRVTSPYSPEHYIDVPDEWLGKHARRHDEAAERGKDLPPTWRDFAVAMALLDDWNLPGLPKNPELWDFEGLNLHVMMWVKTAVLSSYYDCYKVPKNS